MAMTVTRSDVRILATGLLLGDAWHIEVNRAHFIVSAVSLRYAGLFADDRTSETMVFAADETGKVVSYSDLVVIDGKDHEAAIAELLEQLNEDAEAA